jgi:DNA-directed RNA polymerase specialized sigma24 family protein
MDEQLDRPHGVLESLLLSPDASQEALARALVAEHYPPAFRLALALLGEPAMARQATRLALAWAILERRSYHKAGSIRPWLYSRVIKAIQRTERHKPVSIPESSPATTKESGETPGPTPGETRLWQAIDSLGRRERLLAVLLYASDWRESEAARLLRVSPGAIRMQVELFHKRFADLIEAGVEIEAAGALRDQRIDESIAQALHKRWPVAVLTPEENEALIAEVLETARQEGAARQRQRPLKALAITGSALAGVAVLAAGILVWQAGIFQAGLQAVYLPDPTLQAMPSPTPFEAPPKAKPLSTRSSSEEILGRMRESPTLWTTLWIDVQAIDYGPQSYIGPSRGYRAQAWISQPSRSLEIWGLAGERPSSLYLVRDDAAFLLAPAAETLQRLPWDSQSGALLKSKILEEMVFPASSVWASGPGVFIASGRERMAGRQAIVVDWLNAQGGRQRRLWIDAATGLILRLQEYGGADYKLLLSDSLVTDIAYDEEFPYPALYDPERMWGFDFSASHLAPSIASNQPRSESGLASADRAQQPLETPPQGLNPARSYLTFQYQEDGTLSQAQDNSSVAPADLMADGYFLGEVPSGLPWMMQCARSPDGERLAFNTGTDGTNTADLSLRWLNLSDLAQIYQVLPGISATNFSFAPDSRHLAVFGFGEGKLSSGIYLVDLGTGEHELLLNLSEATSLVWSPDGEYLALAGKGNAQAEETVYVIQMLTRQVIHQFGLRFLDAQSAPDWPMASWGVQFPVEMDGMDACAVPPTE